MALDPLASLADLDARTIEAADEQLAATYLGVASAAVRDAAGVPISRITSTVDLTGDGVRLDLPGGPVVSVATVVLGGQAVTDWRHLPGTRTLMRPSGWQVIGDLMPSIATVTWTHGLTVVPADIVDLVARMTTAALLLASAGDGGEGLALDDVTSERLGDYAVTYAADTGTTEMEVSERLTRKLRARFGGGAAMVRSW